jgi:hypothetical protein
MNPMSSVSGLSKSQRINARSRARDAAWLCYSNRGRVHYTQGARRWDGINKKMNARMGAYPKYADCSSFATWCLWNGLFIPFDCKDTVNGTNWRAGYTGTMLNHGKEVVHIENTLIGDCVIYGGGTGSHTAMIVKGGNVVKTPMVMSHGSEPGPFYVPYNYRSDINCIRRYI